MLVKTLVVFYVWSPNIFVLFFLSNLFSGIVYSIMSNKTLPYHTIITIEQTPKKIAIRFSNILTIEIHLSLK